METTVRFTYKPFAACVGLCLTLDKKCFPQEMWLSKQEIDALLKEESWATVVTYNNTDIGLAITISEPHAAVILDGIDDQYTPHENGAYAYSEAIDPQYQKHGIGRLLLKETERFAAQKGFTVLTAHVRTINGWDKARNDTLHVVESRPVKDFWQDPREQVRYQKALI